MPSQYINTEIIKLPYRNYSSIVKAFALRLIGVHEMIDYFSGVDKNVFFMGGGGGIMVVLP